MNPARRVSMEGRPMRATRVSRPAARRTATHKSAARKTAATPRPAPGAKPGTRLLPTPPEQVSFRFCKPGWAVIVEKTASALGTRFVCPFCTVSHRVPGPVRGFRKVRRAQWVKLRRVTE
jgi:hypothetical protein